MPPTSYLADWQHLTGNPGMPGQPDPTTTVTETLGDFVADYDVEALTEEYLRQIRAAVEKIDPDLHLAEDGELFGPAGRVYSADANPVVRVREAIEDADLLGLAEDYDRTAGPYRIECFPKSNDSAMARKVYDYDNEDEDQTLAGAIELSRTSYADANGLSVDDVSIRILDGDPLNDNPRPTGATILRMNALELPHRLAINPNGAEFHIDGLEFDARSGQVIIQLSRYDDDGKLIPHSQVGVFTLAGWTIQ